MALYTEALAAAAVDPSMATGATRHYRNGILQPVPAYVAIVRLASERGLYLLYFDHDGNEINDTFHEHVEDAKRQAAFEFGPNLAWQPVVTFPILKLP